jgi:hypothetical protein
MEEYTKEFFWDVYKTLPEDLKEAIFSERNNQIIYNACSSLGLDEDQTAAVAKYTGRVLMGLLPLKEFSVTLELELNIPEGLAEKIDREITLGIFKHLRVSLTKMDEQKGIHPHIPKFYDDTFTEEKEPEKKEAENKKDAEKEKPNTPGKKESIIFPFIETLESLFKKNPPIEDIVLEEPRKENLLKTENPIKENFALSDMDGGETIQTRPPEAEPEPPMPAPPNPIEEAISQINQSIEKKPVETKPAPATNSNYKDPYRELPL